MSDSNLRALERAASQGDLEAHGRLLRERVREGSLDPEALEGLAHMLWPPAWEALGWQPHGHSGAPSEGFRSKLFKREGQDQLYEIYVRFDRWAHCLRRWGTQASLRVGLAAAYCRLASWEKQHDALAKNWDMPCSKDRVRAFLHMVELQIMLPDGYPLICWGGDEPAQYRSASTYTLEHEGRLLISNISGFTRIDEPRIIPLFAGHLGIFAGRGGYEDLGVCLQDCCDDWPPSHSQPCEACHELRDRHAGDHQFIPMNDEGVWCRHILRREGNVFEAIHAELVPWVLGEGDPVAERIAENKVQYEGKHVES